MGYFIKKSLHGQESHVIPSGPTVDRPSSPITAAMRYNTDSDSLEYFNGSVYVDVGKAGDASFAVDHLSSDGITDTFTMTVAETDPSKIVVFIDGLYQAPGLSKAYTVSGFDIVFTSIPPSNLSITIMHGVYGTFVPNGNVIDVNP